MIQNKYSILMRRLFILAFLVGCLVTSGAILPASQAAPASSTYGWPFCYEVPISAECPSGRICCYSHGDCYCEW